MGLSFEVSSVAAKGPKQSKCPLVESWVNQLWYIRMIGTLHRMLFPLCKTPFSLSLLVISSCSAYHNLLMENISDLADQI